MQLMTHVSNIDVCIRTLQVILIIHLWSLFDFFHFPSLSLSSYLKSQLQSFLFLVH